MLFFNTTSVPVSFFSVKQVLIPDQIKRRIATCNWEQACIEHERNRYRKTDPANWCPEAKAVYRIAIDRKMKKGIGVVIR